MRGVRHNKGMQQTKRRILQERALRARTSFSHASELMHGVMSTMRIRMDAP
jgi:hypothetical protein